MAEKKPILILQMQRMGDLILSFPLFLWLQRTYPGHPIWVVAEENFYKPLMPIAPQVVFAPWQGTNYLLKHHYALVINLSIRPKAAQLAAEAKAEEKIGPLMQDGVTHIRGQWQLFRASLVNNNRFNRFHWAELNALDVVPYARVAKTEFETPRTLPKDVTKVGLFLGASEEAKRPSSLFWAKLVFQLRKRGLRPVLFGGPAEVKLGREVEKQCNGPVLNLCGKTGLDEFAAIGQTLGLFVTPDTGPMHLAAWTSIKCLNLSMGNVNPWETGPYQPGHFALRANMECARGCWTCHQDRLMCRDPFDHMRIAAFIARMTTGAGEKGLDKMRFPGLDLMRTGSSDRGLYHLEQLSSTKGPDAEETDLRPTTMEEERLLGRFWQAWFGSRFGLWDMGRAKADWRKFANSYPQTAEGMLSHVATMGKQFRHGLATGTMLDESFWEQSPARWRPFTGYAHMALQNEGFSHKAWSESVEMIESFIATIQD